jgi:hypothetical protein
MNLTRNKGEYLIVIWDRHYHIIQEKILEANWMDLSHNTRKGLIDKLNVCVIQYRSMIERHIGWLCNTTH